MTTVDKRARNNSLAREDALSMALPSGKTESLSEEELALATTLGDELLEATPGLVFDRIRPRGKAVLVEKNYVTVAGVIFALLATPVVVVTPFAPVYLSKFLMPFIVGFGSGVVNIIAFLVIVLLAAAIAFPLLALTGYGAVKGTNTINLALSRKSPLAGMPFRKKREALKKLLSTGAAIVSADTTSSEIKIRVAFFDSLDIRDMVISYDPVDESKEWRQALDRHLSASAGAGASLQAAISHAEPRPQKSLPDAGPNLIDRASAWFTGSKAAKG